MNKKNVSICTCFVLLLMSLQNIVQAQQKFNLTIPGDAKPTSIAEIKGNTLTVTRPTGKSFIYIRSPLNDQREYQAYWGAATNQFVRFPIDAGGKKMQLGRRSGLTLTWTDSQMRVWKVGDKTGSTKPGLGIGKMAGGGSKVIGGIAPIGSVARPSQIDVNGTSFVAYVDSKGKLQMYRENSTGKWERQKLTWSHQLLPNACVGLCRPNLSETKPGVVTINVTKNMVFVRDGKTSVLLTGSKGGSPDFVPGGFVAMSPDGESCFSSDSAGMLWETNFSVSDIRSVEDRPNNIAPGCPLSANNDDLFVIGKQGELVCYSRNGSDWTKPSLLGKGFKSGGNISSWRGGGLLGNQKAVASVNQNGNPQIYVWGKNRWESEILSSVTLTPGAPIGIGNRSGALVVSFVDKKGNWLTYRRSSGGLTPSWTPNTLSAGISTSSPLLLGSNASLAFSINNKGQLISARFNRNRWNLTPFQGLLGQGFGQRILTRKVVPDAPLASAEIVLKNDHKEPLVVRVYDRSNKKKKFDFTLRPFQTKKITIERDPGGTVFETIEKSSPRGISTVETQTKIPPKVLYDIVVFENAVTSQFFDRTKPKSKYSKKPDSESRSLRSIGVFEVPPGSEMKSGSQLSAYTEAKRMNNPGGASLFGPINQ